MAAGVFFAHVVSQLLLILFKNEPIRAQVVLRADHVLGVEVVVVWALEAGRVPSDQAFSDLKHGIPAHGVKGLLAELLASDLAFEVRPGFAVDEVIVVTD